MELRICCRILRPCQSAISLLGVVRAQLRFFQRGHSYDDADLLSVDNDGRTCLHFAASRGNLDVLSYLVGRVSLEDVEKQNIRGRRPFHYATESSRAAGIIDILMKRGYNVYAARMYSVWSGNDQGEVIDGLEKL